MSTSPDPRREQPGTYGVDRANTEELRRLQLQNRLLNASMGGLLPEQADPEHFTRALDVGCGTGGWLIELAQTYPNISKLFGVDVSGPMLNFARTQAAAAGVGERVEFLVMDALRMLEFPNGFFDLVNQRLGVSWLRTWDWPKLLQEYLRVTRSGGVIRVTEVSTAPLESSSPALMQICDLGLKTLFQAGHYFRPTGDGVTSELARLLTQHGVQHVQTRDYPLEYRAGTTEGQLYAEDMQQLFRNIKPFMQKWIHLPADYETLYEQMLAEMHMPNFTATVGFVTAWGTKQ